MHIGSKRRIRVETMEDSTMEDLIMEDSNEAIEEDMEEEEEQDTMGEEAYKFPSSTAVKWTTYMVLYQATCPTLIFPQCRPCHRIFPKVVGKVGTKKLAL
jgi:hypothetical protein